MEYKFLNGNSTQQQLWERAPDLLMHMPRASLPVRIEVSFEPPEDIGQTAFAETTWEYDSSLSTTKVRNDAPGFASADAGMISEAAALGLTYNARRFFNETAIHELGHSLFAALPQAVRIAIAAMFGASGDSEAELAPPGSDWHDRIIEAIAETFKEAFMPRRHRVFGNRTNLHISYSRYPEFRALFRRGAEEAGGTLGPGETKIPKNDLDVVLQGGVRNQASHLVGFGEMDVIQGNGGFSKTFSSIAPDYAGLSVQIGIESFINLHGVWLPDGATYEFPLVIPASALDPASFNASGKSTEIWLIFWRSKIEGGETDFLVSDEINHFPGGSPIYTVRHFPGSLKEVFESEVPPPWHITVTLKVDSFFTTTAMCEGVKYRKVFFDGFYVVDTAKTIKEGPGITHDELRKNVVLPWLPSWPIETAGCPMAGEPIDTPSGLVLPGGSRRGVHPSPHAIVGRRG